MRLFAQEVKAELLTTAIDGFPTHVSRLWTLHPDHDSQVSLGPQMSCDVSGSPRSIAFFYGTLKHNFPNWHVVPETVIFLGTARTSVPYPLVIDTEMRVPYMLLLPGHPHAHCVHGELYSVNPEELELLDRFEGVPTDFYARRTVDVIVTAEDDERERQPDPVTGKTIMTGSVVRSEAYFRSKGGPRWAHKWSVERLQTLPMSGRYTLMDSEDYVLHPRRPTES